MKHFIVLAVFALVACAFVEGRAIRDLKSELITKSAELLKKADAAIKKLETEKNTHEATIVKTEEAKIKKLVTELEAATDAAKITHIEANLKKAEQKLEYELQKIETGKKDQKAKLLKKAQALEKQAEELIKKLKEEKKDAEAAAIEKDEALVKKFVKELQDATTPVDVAKVEKELADAEKRLAKDIKKPAKRDVKSTLITKGNSLLKQADEAIKKLEAEKDTHEAAVVKSEEAKIKKLIADLEAATDDAKVTKIEHDLKAAETKLQFELQKIAHKKSTGNDAKKAALLKRAQTLEKQAEALIKKLKADSKDAEAAVIEKDEALVKKFVKELQDAKTPVDIAHVEKELAAAEARLAKDLHAPKPKRDVKSSLIAKGNSLLKQADEAIKKLEAEKDTHEAAVVKSEEAKIKKLIADLEAATDDAKVTKIEHDLKAAETKLQFELQKIAHKKSTGNDAKKAALLKRAQSLEKQAEALIKKLKAESKDAEAAVIEKDEALVKKFVKELQDAKTPVDIAHVEKELAAAEARLSKDIKKPA